MFCCSACGVGCASGWIDSVVQVLILCVILYYNLLPSLSLRLLQLSIAISSSVARGGGSSPLPHWRVKYAKSHVLGAFEADFW